MKNVTLITASIALLTAIAMVVLSFAPSFSQLTWTKFDYLLYAFLISIIVSFFLRAIFGEIKDKFVIGKSRVKHFDLVTAMLFCGVLIFSVNNDIHIIEQLHLIFTGLAIATPYFCLLARQRDKLSLISAIMATSCGLIGFSVGFFTSMYSTGEGELLAAFPLSIDLLFSKTSKL